MQVLRSVYTTTSCSGIKTVLSCLTLAGRVLAGNAGSALLLLPKEASDRRLDALLLGRFVERVLAAVTAAGVTALAVQQACQTVAPNSNLLEGLNQIARVLLLKRLHCDKHKAVLPSNVSDVFMTSGVPGLSVQAHGAWSRGR